MIGRSRIIAPAGRDPSFIPRMPGLRAAAPLLAIALLLVASAPPARAQNDTARLLSLRDAWAGLNMFWIGSCPGECATWPFVTWVPGPAPPQFVEGMYVRPVIASANLGSDLSGFDERDPRARQRKWHTVANGSAAITHSYL